MRKAYWEGYIELNNDRGLERIEIYSDPPFVDIYVNDELADDVEDKAYFADEYGSRFYKTLEDYKADNWLSIDEVWPQEGN
jgi:hypothetical protein